MNRPRYRRTVLAGISVLAAAVAVPVAHAQVVTTTKAAVTLAPGVSLRHTTFRMRSGSTTVPERVVTLSITLSAKTALVAAAPKDVIGAPRATVLAMARQEHAVAGINGDFFYLTDPTAVPRGGLTHLGVPLKSALDGQPAALYETTAGRATIGDPGFAGSVATTDGHEFQIRSLNSLENAKNGGLSIVDRNVLAAKLPGCTVARLTPTRTSGRYTVRSVTTKVTRYTRAAVGARQLVTCKGGQKWVQANLVAGHTVQISAGYAVRHIRTLLSGGRVLIRSSKRYHDKNGLLGYGNQRKPETFACVKPGGRHVLLGVVEGDIAGAAGMTYAELTTYLLHQGCASAMTLDGSGSSTLVAKRPHKTLAVENHTTNKGGPRQVVDGLFVVRS